MNPSPTSAASPFLRHPKYLDEQGDLATLLRQVRDKKVNNMKKIAATLVALTPMFTWAQSLSDTIQLDVNGESIEATLAERLSSQNSYRLTFETASGDTQHLGFMHRRGDNQLISITHPQVGSVTIRVVNGKTVIENAIHRPQNRSNPKQSVRQQPL